MILQLTLRNTLLHYTNLFRSAEKNAEEAEDKADTDKKEKKVDKKSKDKKKNKKTKKKSDKKDKKENDKTHKYTINIKEDRKSTRLNSSHVAISYAVFCLKKKNEKTGD